MGKSIIAAAVKGQEQPSIFSASSSRHSRSMPSWGCKPPLPPQSLDALPTLSTCNIIALLNPAALRTQVSAELLRHLLQLASQHLGGQTPQQVVVTVPAYFNAAQRTATVKAARLAGIAQVSCCKHRQCSTASGSSSSGELPAVLARSAACRNSDGQQSQQVATPAAAAAVGRPLPCQPQVFSCLCAAGCLQPMHV